ncbi:MAG: hypothetical protein KA744_07615 [Phenylobacterium sp.]|jgi:hypothetical protein|nr:hypothetical protein [Phenylobacterium sp.]
MQLPTVNLNGTSKGDLLEQQVEAMEAIRAAIEAAQQACPNGRDYVPQGSPEAQAALQRALVEHCDRVSRLQVLLKEYETIAEHVA